MSESRWLPLRAFRDPTIPKLDNLRRAARARLTVPPTWWLPARSIPERASLPPCSLPCILRSGSPTEDTRETSNAGQLLSLVVRSEKDFHRSARQVAAALPVDSVGAPKGVVFVQPFLDTVEAGIAFTDGFYFERTVAPGRNQELTAGTARGDVMRGHLQRGDPWSQWLASVYGVFGREAGGEAQIDIEFARSEAGYVLLQVRPALFPVCRNETLSLANHKEILGDPPSPWIVSVLGEAGEHVLDFYAQIDPEVGEWDERYAIVLAERAWMNFSVFYRLMDRWGLPRAFVTEGVGGELSHPEDRCLNIFRLARSAPRLIRLQWLSLKTAWSADDALRELDHKLDTAQGLAALYEANVCAMAMAIRTNFAINALLTGVARVRRFLRVPNAGRVVTQEMMEAYQAFSHLPNEAARRVALEQWLRQYGHRGPLESDPMRPRFSELKETLLQDLRHAPVAEGAKRLRQRSIGKAMLRPFFLVDARREWFRDELMRRWQRIRGKALEEGKRLVMTGVLKRAEDVFLLRGEEIRAGGSFGEVVEAARLRRETAKRLELPLTATRDALNTLLQTGRGQEESESSLSVFPGIALSTEIFEGRAVLADDLLALLSEVEGGSIVLDESTVLVVPALEPSWAVVFPRVGGVVAEIGGELSHASILMREARKPALVNCAGIFRQVCPGERLRLNGAQNRVERTNR